MSNHITNLHNASVYASGSINLLLFGSYIGYFFPGTSASISLSSFFAFDAS